MNRVWQLMLLLGIAAFASAALYFTLKYAVVVPVQGQEIDLQEEEVVKEESLILTEAKALVYSETCQTLMERAGKDVLTNAEANNVASCYMQMFGQAPVVVVDPPNIPDITLEDYAKWGLQAKKHVDDDVKTLKGSILITNKKTLQEVKEAVIIKEDVKIIE